jgi:hypothetical protein
MFTSLFQVLDGGASENRKLDSNSLILTMFTMIKSDLDAMKTENINLKKKTKKLKEDNFMLKNTFELEVLRKENEVLKIENQKCKKRLII